MNLRTINEQLSAIVGENGSLAENLATLQDEVISAYESIEEKGGELPENKNTRNLPNAIASLGGES